MKTKKQYTTKEIVIRVAVIVAASLAVLLLLAFVAYHAILDYYISKINIVTHEETEEGTDDMIYITVPITDDGEFDPGMFDPDPPLTEEDLPTTGGTGEPVTGEPVTGEPTTGEEPKTEETPPKTEEKPVIIDYETLMNGKNLPLICDTDTVTNILLLATDTRKAGYAGRSDVMILLSVNKETRKIVLCSFMRDLYARYPTSPRNPINGGLDKLNHAFAYGGPKLTMAVFKETFNIDVKYYVQVDFGSFISIVDSVGGLDMELSLGEVQYINSHATYGSASGFISPDYKIERLTEIAGVHHLNGVQALSHARNRTTPGFMNGSDWERTNRQRKVIIAVAEKAGKMNFSQLNTMLNTVLPQITTNIPKSMLKDMVGYLPVYLSYSIQSTRIPLAGSYQSINYNLVPDLNKNCRYLYREIYGKEAP
ncbi:MAG: LCP family protein [Clostridia bacterium]|nr:LCP family protein [Clostridia bacterium]